MSTFRSSYRSANNDGRIFHMTDAYVLEKSGLARVTAVARSNCEIVKGTTDVVDVQACAIPNDSHHACYS